MTKAEKLLSLNLKITKEKNGWSLINYTIPIVYRNNKGDVFFNKDKYSVSTSKIQNDIKKHLAGTKYKEVTGDEIKKEVEK